MTIILSDRMAALHRRTVEAAILAPSAENTQPWHFHSEGNGLLICLDESRVLASDVDSMLDLTSLGTCLENAVIAARQSGYEPTVTTKFNSWETRQQENLLPVAKLDFSEPGAVDPLFAHLATRCTSRRMQRTPIATQQLEEIYRSISTFSAVQLDWITDPGDVREIAQLAGIGNRIRFEYEPFHQEFYNNVRGSQRAAESTRDGLDLATLQLPIGVAGILNFLRKWPRMRAANRLGFSRSVARQAAAEVRSSGALGVLTVDDPTPESFLCGGRALQRLWLTATANQLGLHPTAALPVFLAYAERTDGSRLLPKHHRMAQGMHDRFNRLFPQLRGRTVQMVFRLGYANQPKVRSLRRSATDVLDFNSGPIPS